MAAAVSSTPQYGGNSRNATRVDNGNSGGCRAIEGIKKLSQKVGEVRSRDLKTGEKLAASSTDQCRSRRDLTDETKTSKSALRVESQSAVKCAFKENKPAKVVAPVTRTDKNPENHPMIPIPRPPRKVELRGGDLFSECLCLKWNGLQEDCPKFDCQGQAACMTWPTPSCQPSGLGVPIVPEPRVKRPSSPDCEKLAEESRVIAEVSKSTRAQGTETKKSTRAPAPSEVKKSTKKTLVDMAREQYPIDRPKDPKKFRPCKLHDGRYRARPPMRDQVTQTENTKDSDRVSRSSECSERALESRESNKDKEISTSSQEEQRQDQSAKDITMK